MATLCISALPPAAAPRQSRLLDLTRILNEQGEQVELVFYGSGIYSLVDGSQPATALTETGVKIYAVAGDVESRGLANRLIPQAELVDYAQIVDMIMEADRTITGL